jgi:hypothetical protein
MVDPQYLHPLIIAPMLRYDRCSHRVLWQFNRPQFNKVLSCLHPDSRNSLSDDKMNEAFRIFKNRKMLLVKKDEMPKWHLARADYRPVITNRHTPPPPSRSRVFQFHRFLCRFGEKPRTCQAVVFGIMVNCVENIIGQSDIDAHGFCHW